MRTKRALYNITASISLQVISVIMGLVIPRLFIQMYGSVINGLNASIAQIMIYLNLVEAGIGAASIQALYSPLVEKNKDKINSILSATRYFYNQSGVAFTSLVIGLAFLFPFMIKDNIPFMTVCVLVLITGSSSILDYFFTGKYTVLLQADQKNYVIVISQIASMVISFVVKLILILNRESVFWVQSVSTFVLVLKIVYLKTYFSRKYIGISFNGKPDKKAINKRWDVVVHQIGGLIFNNTDIVVLTIFCGLTTVSIYSIYNYVFTALSAITLSFSSALTPAFGEIIAEKDEALLKRSYNRYEFLYFLVLFTIYTVTYIMVIPFIKLYTAGIHDANYVDLWLPLLFIIIRILSGIRMPPVTLIDAAGHFKETKYRSLLESGINIVVSLLLVNVMGIYGVLIGTIAALLYRTIDIILYTNKRILKQSYRVTVGRSIFNIILASLLSVVLTIFFKVGAINLTQWMVRALITTIIVCSVTCIGNALREPQSAKESIRFIKGFIMNRK